MQFSDSKYLAVKLKGLSHWIWFERAKTEKEAGRFKGIDGWGEDGAFTEIDTDTDNIDGYLYSEKLQYGD